MDVPLKKRKLQFEQVDQDQPADPQAAVVVPDPQAAVVVPDPQPVEPQPQETINGQYASPSNFRDRCALFGCEVALQAAQEEVYYCCDNHRQFCELWSSSATKAYQVFDGLEKGRRESVSFASLLLKLDGINSGIPTLPTELVFSKVPWEKGEVFGQSDVPTYTSRDWMFFAKPPPVHKKLTSELGVECKWHGQHPKLVAFDQQYIRSTSYKLDVKQTSEKQRRGEWRLHQFLYKDLSLYCLSHIVTPKEKPAGPSSETTKTPVSGHRDSTEDDATGADEGSAERDKNQSTTSTTKTQNVGSYNGLKSRSTDAALPPMDGAFKRIMEQDTELPCNKKSIMDAFRGSFKVKLRKASTRSGDANPIQDFEGMISRGVGSAWNARATSEMEIVLLMNVCSVYLKALSWNRSKKIITSILKSEAADSVVDEDAGDITVKQEPKLEG